jgi:hypothetical protein
MYFMSLSPKKKNSAVVAKSRGHFASNGLIRALQEPRYRRLFHCIKDNYTSTSSRNERRLGTNTCSSSAREKNVFITEMQSWQKIACTLRLYQVRSNFFKFVGNNNSLVVNLSVDRVFICLLTTTPYYVPGTDELVFLLQERSSP